VVLSYITAAGPKVQTLSIEISADKRSCLSLYGIERLISRYVQAPTITSAKRMMARPNFYELNNHIGLDVSTGAESNQRNFHSSINISCFEIEQVIFPQHAEY
jgi:hypothetical protein